MSSVKATLKGLRLVRICSLELFQALEHAGASMNAKASARSIDTLRTFKLLALFTFDKKSNRTYGIKLVRSGLPWKYCFGCSFARRPMRNQ